MNSFRTSIILALAIASAGISVARAADVTKTLPTKKFKLHKLSAAFKTSEMAGAEVPIVHPEYQMPGVILGDAVRYRAVFSPALTLPADRYAWSGAVSNLGPLVDISYSQSALSLLNLTVFDRHINSSRSIAIETRIRSVGTETEPGICITINPILQVQCAIGAQDSNVAVSWAQSGPTRNALDDHFPVGKDNGKPNAAQHSYWNALMARDLGPTVAERFATAHEKLSITNHGVDGGDPHNGTVMDLGNNARGRLIAANLELDPDPGEPSSLAEGVIIDDINAGNMTILHDIDNAGRAALLQPSDRPIINTP